MTMMGIPESIRKFDQDDSLRQFRERFYIPEGTTYLDGNSLGLLSVDAEAELLDALDEWKTLAIEGWLHADPPWYYLGEELGSRMAFLMGADASEVIATGGTTINLHALLSTFYQPRPNRRHILADALNFPSDLYALQSQIRLRGGHPDNDLVLIAADAEGFLSENDIIEAMTPEVAVAVLPSVLYRSGQLLDIERLAHEAQRRDILLGVDCSHSVGSVPHELSRWGVDFAFWCTYKHLNSGPGGIGGLYVNRKHFGQMPGLSGWWGSNKATQFQMDVKFSPAPNAGAWQIGTPSLFSAAPLFGSLRLLEEASIEGIRQKSLALTGYLMERVDARLTDHGFSLQTPREPYRRGGHVAIAHPEAYRITQVLKQRRIIPDFREPNMIRLAPVALYNTFAEIWTVVETLRDIVATAAYEEIPPNRDVVS